MADDERQQHTQFNPTSGVLVGGVYVALPLPCKGREVVPDKERSRHKIYDNGFIGLNQAVKILDKRHKLLIIDINFS